MLTNIDVKAYPKKTPKGTPNCKYVNHNVFFFIPNKSTQTGK